MHWSDLVFVYGTLRRGECNHHYLSGARWLGIHRTDPCYTLLDLGEYPAMISSGKTAIVGEVYAINDFLMARLDWLEDYPEEYIRERIPTPYGLAWIYIYRHPTANVPVIASGDWRNKLRKQRQGRSAHSQGPSS